MSKTTIKYIIYIFIGAVLGALMQLMPQLQGQWGQNIFAYMASDLGSWAVICILIATYAETSRQSGFQCFVCMVAMVAVYYIIVLEKFTNNLIWVVMAILIFPIGMITYWYKQKAWVMIVLELFLAVNVALDMIMLVDMINMGTMIVHSTEGAVFTDLTIFAIGNYMLLIAFTVFGMLYMPLKYRKEKQKVN